MHHLRSSTRVEQPAAPGPGSLAPAGDARKHFSSKTHPMNMRTVRTKVSSTPSSASLVLTAALSVAMPCTAEVVLADAHDGNPAGDGFDVVSTEDHLITPLASFSGNQGNGLFDSAASLIVDGGRFDDNGNVGLQAVFAAPSALTITINDGSFSGNKAAGVDVYEGQLLVNGGMFSRNGAYGLSTHGDSYIQGGSFSDNGLFGLVAWSSTAYVYGGIFSGNQQQDFSAIDTGTVALFGWFDTSGELTGSGSFTGTLLDGNEAHTYSYVTYGAGKIVLNAVAAPVPEPPALVLMVLGCMALAAPFRFHRGAASLRGGGGLRT